MSWNQLLFMRHEIILIILLLVMIIANLLTKDENKEKLIHLASILFFVNLIAGFLPTRYGSAFGSMFVANQSGIMMKNILNIATFIVILQSGEWLKKEIENKPRIADFFILILSSLTGMFFMISSGHFLMLFIGLELATIPVAALAAFEQSKRKSAEAGVKLILLSTFSAAIMLFGLGMIYGNSGSMYFNEVLTNFDANALGMLGFVFFFSGLAFKISIVPFHLWTADVYEGAPVNITSYLSVVSKAAALYILMVVFYTVFINISASWTEILYIVSILTMTLGNLFAIRQKNIKRFMAFSSIAQAGFILLGIIGGAGMGMTVVMYFILIYVFSNLAVFGVATSVYRHSGKEKIRDLDAFYQTNPRLSLIMMLALFSLAGIPPVAGFFGKFFLFTAAASKGYFWLVLIAVLNATISLYYYLMIVKAMFINQSDQPIDTLRSDLPMRLSLLICAIALLAIGFIGPLYEWINNVATSF